MNPDGAQSRDYDSQQTRRFHLAGTTPLPVDYPSVGTVSIEQGSLHFTARDPSRAIETTWFVVVKEQPCGDESVTRAIRQTDVAAIFYHGWFDEHDVFQFSDAARVEDIEKGQWFFGPDVSLEQVKEKLKREESELSGPEAIAKGIAFVPEERAVLSTMVREVVTTACRAERPLRDGCECNDLW